MKSNYISNNCIVININNKVGNELNQIVTNMKKISMIGDNVASEIKTPELGKTALPSVKAPIANENNKNYARITEEDSESNDEKDFRSKIMANSKPSKKKVLLHSLIEVSLPQNLNSKLEPNNRYIKTSKGDKKAVKDRFKISYKNSINSTLKGNKKNSIDATSANNSKMSPKMILDTSTMGTGSIIRQLENITRDKNVKRKVGAKKMQQDIANTVNISAINNEKEFNFGHNTHELRKQNKTLEINDDLPKNIAYSYIDNKNILISNGIQSNNDFLPKIEMPSANTPTILASSIPIVDHQCLFTIDLNSVNDKSRIFQVDDTIDESAELPEENKRYHHQVRLDKQKLTHNHIDLTDSKLNSHNRNLTKSPNERKSRKNNQTSSQRK